MSGPIARLRQHLRTRTKREKTPTTGGISRAQSAPVPQQNTSPEEEIRARPEHGDGQNLPALRVLPPSDPDRPPVAAVPESRARRECIDVQSTSGSSDGISVDRSTDGSVTVTLRGADRLFRVSYTTSETTEIHGGTFSDAAHVRSAHIAGRYELSVTRLASGEFEYSLRLSPIITGAILEVGRERYVISNTGVPKNGEQSTAPTSAVETVADYIRTFNGAITPSDHLPPGVSFREALVLNEFIRLQEKRYSDQLSAGEARQLLELGRKHRKVIQKLNHVVVHQVQ